MNCRIPPRNRRALPGRRGRAEYRGDAEQLGGFPYEGGF